MTLRPLRLLESRGHDPEAVCRAAQVSRARVSDPGERIDLASVDRLLEATADVLGDAGLGAALAGVFDEDTYDAAGLLLLMSPTYGEGLRRAFAYQRLWGDGERFSLDAATATVRFRHPGASSRVRAILSELALLEVMGSVRVLVDPHEQAREVRFRHAPLGAVDELTRLLGVTPRFEASDDALVLAPQVLARPVRTPTAMLAQAAERQARRALASLPALDTLPDRIRRACGDGPEAFRVSLEQVAQRLHVSARTLQRQLARQALSFEGLLDDLRRDRARALAERGLSQKEISFLLGFSDPSALRRALRRWRRPVP